MAEIRPTRKTYDIMHPVPISLQELSAIAVSLEIWRCEVNNYRQNGTFREFFPNKRNLSFKSIFPDLPSVICNLIDLYIGRFGSSLDRWLSSQHGRIFYLQYGSSKDVLKDFDDFVCDFDGDIHFAWTAKRIMHFDRFDMVVKFATACNYFFEDDIRRIWPFVSEQMDLKKDNFCRGTILRYWICILTEQYDKLPVSENGSVDERMFQTFHGPAVEYFWNRLPITFRLRNAIRHSRQDEKCFAEFLLPKLDGELLDRFVNSEGRKLILNLCNSSCYERLILSSWMYIKDVMSESTFTNLVVDFLRTESGYLFGDPWSSIYGKIWDIASDNLKRSTTAYISSVRKLTLCKLHDDSDWFSFTAPDFLLIVLSYATSEERSSFWFNCWRNLTLAYTLDNMLKIMKMCIEIDDEIILEQVMAECTRVRNKWDWD